MTRDYYQLIKPGIVYSNALTAVAGFLYAAHGTVAWGTLLAMLGGISCCVAASCVFNNVLDRDIDARMERTKARALPASKIPVRNALMFGAVLGLISVALLFFFTNLLTLAVALFGAFVYLALYTPLKRRTVHGTLVGAVSGAVPPVVGYVAVTNSLDITALILFLILVSWQMVHFFAIAIFRIDDYRAAGIPVFPLWHGIRRTKIIMVVYALLFAYSSLTLYFTGKAGSAYAIVLGALSLGWLIFAFRGFTSGDDTRWARRMFFYSLIVLLGFCAVLVLNSYIT